MSNETEVKSVDVKSELTRNFNEYYETINHLKTKEEILVVTEDLASLMVSCLNKIHDLEKYSLDYKMLGNAIDIIKAICKK